MSVENVVGYCRVSTLEQKKNGYGIDIQKRSIRRYAKTRGWSIQRFYTDEAISGVDEERAALDQLRKDCEQGAIDGVIFASLDRLARSVRHEENLIFEFGQQGVSVYMADMPHYDGKDRKAVLMRQIKAAIAEENRKDIIERLYKGRQERVRKGKFSGGNIPYGFRRIRGKITTSPKEVQIVEIIFRLHSQNQTDNDIAKALNVHGHRRRNQTPWTARQVKKIIERRALYTEGIINYGEVKGENKSLILLPKRYDPAL